MIKEITIQDNEEYPFILKLRKKDPPQKFYCEGTVDLLNSRCIAIIGTRNPTELGMKAAFDWAAFFASQGFTIVSGLALGIDTEAHEGALSVHGKMIAVLGSTLHNIYPKRNQALAKRILEHSGLLLSQYDVDMYAPWRYPERDRIQALLSLAVFPIEAPLKSGTFHAYYQARESHIQVLLPHIWTNTLPQYQGLLQMDGLTITQENKEKISKLLMIKYEELMKKKQ